MCVHYIYCVYNRTHQQQRERTEMTKQVSEHAAAAKLIRAELKKHNITGTVRAKSYAGGSSITVTLNNELPATHKAVKLFCSKFQYGHFDGMQDLYELTNINENLPQVMFVFVNNEFSDELRQAAWDLLRETMQDFENAPKCQTRAGEVRCGYSWGNEWVYKVLNGSQDFGFWRSRKQRVLIAG